MDIALYVNDITPQCRTVLMVINELKLKLDIREISLEKKEHLTEKFLKVKNSTLSNKRNALKWNSNFYLFLTFFTR